jgi:hypothetical protein
MTAMARDLSALTRVHTLLDQLVVEQGQTPSVQTPGNPSETISQIHLKLAQS